MELHSPKLCILLILSIYFSCALGYFRILGKSSRPTDLPAQLGVYPPTRELPLAFHGCLNQYSEAVAREIGRARRRVSLLEYVRDEMNVDPIRLDDGAVSQAPSDDEDLPALPSGALALHPLFSSLESS